MCLVHPDFSVTSHVEEPLLGMDVTLGSDPRSRVESGGSVSASHVLPLDTQSDRVLGVDVPTCGDAGGGDGRDGQRPRKLPDRPEVEVHVMRVQVVANVAALARPAAKRVELRLGLAHVGTEETELPQTADAVPGIGVDRIPALVDFHGHQDILPVGRIGQFKMLLYCLDHRFCDQHMASAIHGIQGDAEMRVVGRENRHQVSGRQIVQGSSVRCPVRRDVVVGIAVECDIQASVDVGHRPLNVLADAGELRPVRPRHSELADLAPAAEIEQR